MAVRLAEIQSFHWHAVLIIPGCMCSSALDVRFSQLEDDQGFTVSLTSAAHEQQRISNVVH